MSNNILLYCKLGMISTRFCFVAPVLLLYSLSAKTRTLDYEFLISHL